MIGAYPLHALGGTSKATENIAAADDQRHLRSGLNTGNDFIGHAGHRIKINAEGLGTHQHLT